MTTKDTPSPGAADNFVPFPLTNQGNGARLQPTPAAQGAVTDRLNGARKLPFDRDTLGRMVREAWVRWAEAQPSPKPSWLVPYDQLSEPDKEADRQVGEAIARWTLIGDAAQGAVAPRFENVSCSQCGREFGPGDYGFSHCDQHTPTTDPWKDIPPHYKKERWGVDHRDNDGMFFVHSGGYGICQAEESEVCFAVAAAFNAAHFSKPSEATQKLSLAPQIEKERAAQGAVAEGWLEDYIGGLKWTISDANAHNDKKAAAHASAQLEAAEFIHDALAAAPQPPVAGGGGMADLHPGWKENKDGSVTIADNAMHDHLIQSLAPATERNAVLEEAADDFRNSLVPRADQMVFDVAPLWHGWAIFEAFLAGARFARAAIKGEGK